MKSAQAVDHKHGVRITIIGVAVCWDDTTVYYASLEELNGEEW